MRRALLLVLPLVVVFALAIWRAEGPPPKTAGAPSGEFSAARAMEVLRHNLQEGVPHPIGSAANARVRDRIAARLRALGYRTTIQRRFACNASASCGTVENIIAETGDARGDVVLLAAHYDSVPSGPGASDDGVGVATLLEVARALRSERFRNRVVFLIDDGEEAGLLGAEAFVADESLSKDVGVVVNVEMRGTHGASSMFETSRGNRWLIRHLANALERPLASSLFYSIYDLLPNDTDVTVFKRAGVAAVNFGAIRGVNWYHTPLDDVAHVSPRTLQHHGDNVLALTRVLAEADLAAQSRTDATYFDVLGFTLVWWPREWTIWMAALSLVAFVFASRRTSPRGMTWGVLATFTAIVLSVLGGVAVAWITRLRSEGISFVAHPDAGVAAMWLTGIAAATAGCEIFNLRKDRRALLHGVIIVWHVIGIALALTFPGPSFLFVVPAMAACVATLAGADETIIGAVGSTTAAVLFFPIALTLYDALGSGLMAAIAVLVGIAATLSAPLFASFRISMAALLLAVAFALVAIMLPAYTREKPRFASLTYVDDPAFGGAVWATSTLPPPLATSAPWTPIRSDLVPWSRQQTWSTPARGSGLPRVGLTGERHGSSVKLRVTSRRDAARVTVLLRGGSVRSVNGIVPPPRSARFRSRVPAGWQMAVVYGHSEAVIDVTAGGPVEVIASDTSFGLPPEGAWLSAARQAALATPAHDGDTTITRARAKF